VFNFNIKNPKLRDIYVKLLKNKYFISFLVKLCII